MGADKDIAIYQAIEPFYADGMTIQAGDTVVAGHPILKGRTSLFQPFTPTYDLKRDNAAAADAHRAHDEAVARAEAEAQKAADAAAAAVSFGDLQTRGKALGLKVGGVKRAELEAAIEEAETAQAAETAAAEAAAAATRADAATAAADEAEARAAEPEATG